MSNLDARPAAETGAANSSTSPSSEQPAKESSPVTGSQAEIEKCERMTRERPDAAESWIKLGDALMQRSREKGGEGLWRRAERAYRQALTLQSKATGAMIGMAWVSNSRHEFEEGCHWARQALEIDSHLSEAHALLGDAAVEWGDYDKAFEHYQASLDIRPDLSSCARAAQLLWLTGDASRAKALMRKAIEAGSPHAENTAWCRAQLALMSFHTGALTIAEREAERALKEAPGNRHVLAAMGRILAAKKDYAAAIGCYRRAVESAPEHDALVALGDLYAVTGRSEDAEKTYKRVVALHESHDGHHHHGGEAHHHAHSHGNAQLARFYADQGRNLDEALAEAQTAYQSYSNVFVADTLAWCYYKKGAYDQAGQTIAQALRWNTPDAGILFHAGMIDAKRGDRDSARRHLYEALNLNPHFHIKDGPLAAETLKALTSTPQPTPRVGAATLEQ